MTEPKQSRLLFVNYHYVRDTAYRHPGIHPIGMGALHAQLQNRLDRYHFPLPSEAAAFVLEGRPLPGPSILPTFDDGLMDHWHAAGEVLDPLGIKGAFFVCSRPGVSRRALTVHKIQWLRAHTRPAEFASEFFALLPPKLRPAERESWSARAERTYRYDTPLQARVKFALNFLLPRQLVDDITSRMFAEYGIDERRFCEETYMSEWQLRSLVERGHVVGAHGHTHAPFTQLGDGLLEDVATNVAYLAQATGLAPSWVTYPYGRAEAIPEDAVLDLLFERFGFKLGLTLMGTWNIGGEDAKKLNRINCNELEAVTGNANADSAKSAQV